MARILPLHPTRETLDLGGLWTFQPVPGEVTATTPPRGALGLRMPVPGVWETDLDLFNHRGSGWFRREFDLARDWAQGARLVFEAVSHTARVWLDGVELGSHYGAHTAFSFTLPHLAAGRHRLDVLVDNRYGEMNPLSAAYQDIYTWGGIPREVRLERLGGAVISEASLTPVRVKGGWAVQVEATVTGADTVVFRLDGRQETAIPVRRGKASATVPVRGVREWNPGAAELHVGSLDAGDDRFQVRLGFRTIAIDGRKILVNGRAVALNGVNRHEFHPDFGPAVPAQVHLKDIAILKRLGANFVRGAHYPNDPQFLDLCDEHGLLFWDELSHWQPKENHLKDKAFRAASVVQAREMVQQHRHHPSILCWGFLNEMDSDKPASRPVVKELIKEIRRHDPTRPITYASHRPYNDLCLDLVDIVSFNVYPGWYWCGMHDLQQHLDEKLLPAVRDNSFGKPVIMSEFGAGAMDGVRSFEMRKWTEQYQAELLDILIGTWQRSGYITGCAIWQYCDVRTSVDLGMGRIREYNNKGIVTEYREPKLAFERVRQCFERPWKAVGRR